MVMLVYASPALYRMFCQLTGFGGTTMRASQAPDKILEQSVTVTFNADIQQKLPMTFEPEEKSITLHIGQERLTHYRVKNLSDKPLKVVATYNVTPDAMGRFLNKTQCFCFESLTLNPKQEANLPISFFVDPAATEDKDASKITTLTLSYTFFPAKE